MRHVSPASATFALFMLSALAACKVKDPLYCDPSTPCTDPDRPFCDDEGAYAASEGIKHTCIPYPWDAGPDSDAGPSCSPGEWTLDTVHSMGNVSANPTVVVDATGTVRLAYSVGQPGVLYYARGHAGSWHVIETPEAGGFYPQMAIDSSAILHLVHGGYPGGLRYLRKPLQDNEFDYELVASPLAFDIGFALDSTGAPVACFVDGDSGGPAKCYEDGTGTWQSFDPPRPEAIGGISIAVDSSDVLHLAADGVIYFSREGGEWSAEESASGAGTYPPVAVDSDGVPHVAYADETLCTPTAPRRTTGFVTTSSIPFREMRRPCSSTATTSFTSPMSTSRIRT
jgi:predicted small lipoprotein YifL